MKIEAKRNHADSCFEVLVDGETVGVVSDSLDPLSLVTTMAEVLTGAFSAPVIVPVPVPVPAPEPETEPVLVPEA